MMRSMGLLTGWRLNAASTVPVSPPPVPMASPWADADALTVATWAGLLDAIDCIPATRQQAIALPAVARGRDLICITVARMRLEAMNGDGRLSNQPRIVERPELGRARFITLLWTIDSMLFYGHAVWQVLQRYQEDGRPMTARYVPPGSYETDSTTGEITAVFGRAVSPLDVIRFDGPHEGILTRANEVIRTTRRLATAYAAAAETPNPDVELHQTKGEPLGKTQIDELVAGWAAARRGKNGRVAYTSEAIEAKLHGTQPEDLLIAARNAANIDLARQMNLPAWAVDGEVGGSSLTYTNVPSRWAELIDGTLAGYMEAITGRLSLDDVLARGLWCSFNTDVLTDGNFADRMKAYKDAKDSGVFTPEQLAARERGLPMEGAPIVATPPTATAPVA